MSVRLMIADDHVAIRAGIISLFQGTEIEVICQAESSDQTVKFALTCQPDVLLLDVRLADSDGLDALERIKRESPNIAVVMFSAFAEVKEMAHARKLGAVGFVAKGTSRDELLKCIRRVATGKTAWTPRQIRQVVSRAAAEALAKHDRNPLSPREVEVLVLIANGNSNDGIAGKMMIDIETVKQHVKHILRKLHLEDRTQAALYAVRSNLVDIATVGNDNE